MYRHTSFFYHGIRVEQEYPRQHVLFLYHWAASPSHPASGCMHDAIRRRGTPEPRQLLEAREAICAGAAAATVIENYIYLAYGQGESAPRQFTSLVASAGLRRRMQQQTVSSGWRPSASTGDFSSSTARTLFNPVTHSWAFAAVSARMR